MATSAVQMNGSMVGGSAITPNAKWEYLYALGVDVMGVHVLGLDFMALILWENVSEQGKKRISFVIHPLQHLYLTGYV